MVHHQIENLTECISLMDDKVDVDITHRTVNLYAPDQYIWIFADTPHHMKTTRNCISHSGSLFISHKRDENKQQTLIKQHF